MNGWVQDVRYGIRSLLGARGLALAAVATLALGFGAGTLIFSVVNAVLLRPLPYPQPDRVAIVSMTNAARGATGDPLSVADFLDWRARNASFEKVAAWTDNWISLTDNGEPERVRGAWVTAEFFSALRVDAALGRSFTTGDDEPGRPRMVVLGHDLWQRRFGADPSIVGKTVMLNGSGRTVAGIMPEGFQFPPEMRGSLPGRTQVWMVLPLDPPTRRGPYFLTGLARLRPGATIENARAELRGIGLQLAKETPLTNADSSFEALEVREWLVGGVRRALLVLLGAVAFVLMIASVNVANLLLARASGREQEMAIRSALGAGRGRLLRLVLTESVLLSLAGAAAGLTLAYWSLQFLRALNPENLPRLDEVGIDARVILVVLGAALLSGLQFGLAPALHAVRGVVNEALQQGGRSGTQGRGAQRLRRALVVAEVSLSLVLLIASGLMLNSFLRLQSVNPGFVAEKTLTTEIDLPYARYSEDEKINAFFTQLLERVGQLPGVESAGIGISLPPHKMTISDSFTVEGRPESEAGSTQAAVLFVSSGYFKALGVPVLRGRNFDETDRPGAPVAVIINETLARRYFPEQDPIGKRMKTGGPERPQNQWMEIVGVVGDVRFTGLDAETIPTYYEAYTQVAWSSTYLVVRASGDPRPLGPALRQTVWSLDPALPVPDLKTMDDVLRESVAGPRFRTLMIAGFGTLALLLAGVGIYGVLACSVAQRTREFGVRMALGAEPGDLLTLVIGQGMRMTLIGLVLGAAGALAVTRVLSSLLFGVTPTDALTYTAAAGLLALVALLACAIPALRAMRLGPLTALRHD